MTNRLVELIIRWVPRHRARTSQSTRSSTLQKPDKSQLLQCSYEIVEVLRLCLAMMDFHQVILHAHQCHLVMRLASILLHEHRNPSKKRKRGLKWYQRLWGKDVH